MTYKEALSIFNLDTVTGKDAKVLTKDYRKLVRKWHPDLNHSPNAMKMTSDMARLQVITRITERL